LSTSTPVAPWFAVPRPFGRDAVGEGRQALTGAVLRVLAPLDGSGRARGTRAPLAELAVRRGTPTLRGLVSCRSRPWNRPSELSLLEEPYPLSRASCFLAGSRSTTQRRDRVHGIRGPFPRRADLWPRLAQRAHRTRRLGRRFPGTARHRPGHASAPGHVSPWIGRARRTRQPTRPLRSLAPLESPFSRRSPPWPGDDRQVGALLGFFPSRAFSSIPRVRHARG